MPMPEPRVSAGLPACAAAIVSERNAMFRDETVKFDSGRSDVGGHPVAHRRVSGSLPVAALRLSTMCCGRLVPGSRRSPPGSPGSTSGKTAPSCAQSNSAAHGGTAWSAHALEESTLGERPVGEHGHAAVAGQGQGCGARLHARRGIVDLDEVERLGTQHALQLVVGARRVVRDPEIADAAGRLPLSRDAKMRPPVGGGCGSGSDRAAGRAAA